MLVHGVGQGCRIDVNVRFVTHLLCHRPRYQSIHTCIDTRSTPTTTPSHSNEHHVGAVLPERDALHREFRHHDEQRAL
jgi:hypothetical protein